MQQNGCASLPAHCTQQMRAPAGTRSDSTSCVMITHAQMQCSCGAGNAVHQGSTARPHPPQRPSTPAHLQALHLVQQAAAGRTRWPRINHAEQLQRTAVIKAPNDYQQPWLRKQAMLTICWVDRARRIKTQSCQLLAKSVHNPCPCPPAAAASGRPQTGEQRLCLCPMWPAAQRARRQVPRSKWSAVGVAAS